MSTDFVALLERQLKEKITQKAHEKQSDEAFVIKAMKFFDIYNTGAVTHIQFHSALERIGLFYTFEDLIPALQAYDPEGTGKIDYIDFSKILYKSAVSKAHQRKLSPEELRAETVELLDYFRRTLAGMHGNGLISLKRIFAIVDKDGSGEVSIPEFSSIMKEFKIELSNEQINLIFKIFDFKRDGTLSYGEFMKGVGGSMNDFRSYIVNKAFDKLDVNNQGIINIEIIAGQIDATRHPAVSEGRKSEEQVLAEFFDTFEIHHNLTSGSQNPSVTRAEFIAYYDNISATIKDDEYFANVLDSTWDISGAASHTTHEQTYTDKSKYGDTLNDAYHYTNLDPRDLKSPTLRSGLESSDNPWKTITPYYQLATADRRSLASNHVQRVGRDHREIVGEESKGHLFNSKVIDTYEKHNGANKILLDNPKPTGTLAIRKELELALERFKSNIIQRGTRGIIGLKRQFKILDDSNDGTLDINDFQKGLHDYNVEVPFMDVESLYLGFKIDGTTRINYVGLLDEIIGELNTFRATKVELAWRKIDKDANSFMNWDVIALVFNASRHPGVKAGYITVEEVQHDFEETFKALHSVYHSFQPDMQVTKHEFFDYFKILSSTVPNDRVFDLIMTGVWNVDLRAIDPKTGGVKPDYEFDGSRSAWKYDFHRSIYGKMDNSPFQHPVTGQSAKQERPKTAVSNDMTAAGVYSWPFAQKSSFESSVTCLNSDNLLTKTGYTTDDYDQNQYIHEPGFAVNGNGNGNGTHPQDYYQAPQ
jgi:Ca2+-binding EF-hand superfamily protein